MNQNKQNTLRKFGSIALVLALCGILLCAGCASGSDSSSSITTTTTAFDTVVQESVTESTAGKSSNSTGLMDSGAGTGASELVDTSKMIVTLFYDAEATDFTAATTQLQTLLTSLNGYAEAASVGGDVGYRYANYTLRIPADALDQFTSQFGEVCHVLYTETTQENVSDVYFDIESRLTVLQTTQERLLDLLESAADMEDIITIETKLSEVNYEIESLTGTLRGYDNLINYATVYITLNEVRDLTAINEQPSFGEELQSSFVNGLQNVQRDGQNFLLFLAYNWLGLLIWVAVIATIVCTVRRVLHRKSAKQAEKEAQDLQDFLNRQAPKD